MGFLFVPKANEGGPAIYVVRLLAFLQFSRRRLQEPARGININVHSRLANPEVDLRLGLAG